MSKAKKRRTTGTRKPAVPRLPERSASMEEFDEPHAGPASDTAVVYAHRDRVHPHNPKRLSPTQVADFATILDGLAAGVASSLVAHGHAQEVSELEPWAVLEAARPNSPVEAAVLRAMVLAGAQQRQLIALSGKCPPGSEAARRYAELALRAGREVVRAAEVWRKLHEPAPVHVGPGGQANVVGGDQHVYRSNNKNGGTD